jgi:hypothetical protein
MPPNAYRDRMFPPAEVRRILRRAAALEDSARTPGEAGRGRGHTLDELERIAGDAGISAEALGRAIAGEAEAALAPEQPWFLAGAPERIVVERTVPGEADAASHTKLTKAMRNALGELGSAQVVGDALSWSSATPGGRRVYAVIEREGDGRVTIRVDENLRRLRGAIVQAIGGVVGAGGLAIIAPLVAILSAKLIPFALVAWALVVYLVVRATYRNRYRAREKELQAVAGEVAALVEATGPRVGAGDADRAQAPRGRVAEGRSDEAAADDGDEEVEGNSDSRRRAGRQG